MKSGRTRFAVGLAALAACVGLIGCGRREEASAPPKEAPSSPGEAPGKPPALPLAGKTLELFVGSASKPATEEAAAAFETKTGCKVLLHFGGSGKMLSEMKLGRRGDLYFPGSSDFMELAKKQGEVVADTEKIIVYLIPAINVPAGNPKQIKTLADLAKPSIRLGIARPDSVCVGLYAVEVLTKAGLGDAVKPNIVTHAESCEKTAQLVALGMVDAVLGWRVFHYWQPDKIETVLLDPKQVPRIGYIPIARAKYCTQPEVAQAFVDFLLGEEGKAAFRKWHYLASEDEARKFATAETPVGGEWPLPQGW
jgi:molybdate transport system substrate-binding protein